MTDHNLIPPVIWFNALLLSVPLMIGVLAWRPALWPHVFSAFLGVVVAIVDSASDEVQFPALLLVVFGLFLGFAHPVRAWRWGVFLGASIPIFAWTSLLFQLGAPHPLAERISSLIAFMPSFIGAYGGAGTRRFLSRDRGGPAAP